MRGLPLYSADPNCDLAWPEITHEITLNSSALEIFTDFKIVKPLLVQSTASALEAEKLMQHAHVRLKMVVDSNNHFAGIISLDDLHSQEVMKKVVAGYSREDLTIADFMTPKDKLKTFEYSDIEHATISDIIETLKLAGQQHCLVVEREAHRVRGVISASDIARKLKLPINIVIDSSFANIFKTVSKQLKLV